MEVNGSMITKKFIAILVLMAFLAGIVTFEQIYIDTSVATMKQEINVLISSLEEENLADSTAQAEIIVKMWQEREMIICLFVDYRDIEQIGKQSDLVLSHLKNSDFELAKVECNTLKKVLDTFGNMVNIDWQNIA